VCKCTIGIHHHGALPETHSEISRPIEIHFTSTKQYSPTLSSMESVEFR